MHKKLTVYAWLLAAPLVACAAQGDDVPSAEELEALEQSEAALTVAASELVDQEALSKGENASLEGQASLQSQPIRYCGWPPFCPHTMQMVYYGCDAACYAIYGYDCSWGHNRVDCLPMPPEASITASPQAVTVAPGSLGTTRICWNTKHLNYPVWIRVRVDGGPGQLFTRESDPGNACENAPWIQAGHTYQFSIHDDNADTSPIHASVVVTGVAGSAGPGNPNPGNPNPGNPNPGNPGPGPGPIPTNPN